MVEGTGVEDVGIISDDEEAEVVGTTTSDVEEEDVITLEDVVEGITESLDVFICCEVVEDEMMGSDDAMALVGGGTVDEVESIVEVSTIGLLLLLLLLLVVSIAVVGEEDEEDKVGVSTLTESVVMATDDAVVVMVGGVVILTLASEDAAVSCTVVVSAIVVVGFASLDDIVFDKEVEKEEEEG